MGLDEFYENYLNSMIVGLKNNVYINIMVVWFFDMIIMFWV